MPTNKLRRIASGLCDPPSDAPVPHWNEGPAGGNHGESEPIVTEVRKYVNRPDYDRSENGGNPAR